MRTQVSISRRDVLLGGMSGFGCAQCATAGAAQANSHAANSNARVADLILKNGKVVTVDENFTVAQALAIRDDRVLAVGSNEELKRHTGRDTRIVDLRGKTVIPGLIDGHAHMDREGLKTIFPSLGRVRSIKDVQARISELAQKTRPGEWIVTMPIGDPPFYFEGSDILAEKRWPSRQDLDVAAPKNPVYIRSIWGFWRSTPPLVSCANTAALQRAGISRDTVSPDPALVIEKDKNGDPTGVFIESDLQPLAELIWFREATRFSRADRLRALPSSARAYHAYGTTGVFEEHGVANEVFQIYKEARRNGSLTMRSALVLSPNWKAAAGAALPSFIEAWAGWLAEPTVGDDWLKMTGIYVQTQHRPSDDLRAQAAPYTGWSGANYDTGLNPDRVKELAMECARNDIRIVANNATSPGMLDILESVHKEISLKGRRWVLGHVRSLSLREIERVAAMGLIITPHTNSAIYKFGSGFERTFGPDRRNEIEPLKDLLDAGVPVSLATDNVPVSLFWPIWESVARRSRTNELVAPNQALTRAQAIRCSTVNGASSALRGKAG